MDKKSILILILAIIISGCVSTEQNIKNTSTNVPLPETKNIISSSNNIGTVTAADTPQIVKSDDWCRPGDIIDLQVLGSYEQFIVKGLTNYDGIEVCQSEYIYPGGKSVRYVSEDGKFSSMSSTSSHGAARASSSSTN